LNLKYEENYKKKFDDKFAETKMETDCLSNEVEKWQHFGSKRNKTDGFYYKSTKGFFNENALIKDVDPSIYENSFSLSISKNSSDQKNIGKKLKKTLHFILNIVEFIQAVTIL
jgi:hypothetical protein